MSRIFARYLRQDYLTPGALQTVDVIRRHVRPTDASQLLEIAYGKGTTAITLARESGCRVVGIDPYQAFVAHATRAAASAGVSGRVAFLRGDGGALPLRDDLFDAAYCIGAPSIVGTERCFAAMRRALRPGGVAIGSDWTWRTEDPPAVAVPAGIEGPFLTLERYASVVRGTGFDVVEAMEMPQSVWDDYYAPLRAICAEERAADPDMPRDAIEDEIAAYDAAGRELWAYSTFVAVKR